MAEGASRGLGMKAMMCEFGLEPQLEVIRIHTDSSVAKAFVATRGLGRMRHIDVKLLWLQECVHHGRLNVSKVGGATNVADAMTKYHDVQSLRALLKPHGIVDGPIAKGDRSEGGCAEIDPSRG